MEGGKKKKGKGGLRGLAEARVLWEATGLVLADAPENGVMLSEFHNVT